MRPYRKILGAVAIAVLVGGVATAGVGTWAVQTLGDTCGETLLREVASPTGELRAVIYERNCGATTGFSTQISLLRPGESIAGASGNLFVADRNHGRAPAGPGGGPDVSVRWSSDHLLLVQYDSLARIFKAEQEWNGVRVEYQTR